MNKKVELFILVMLTIILTGCQSDKISSDRENSSIDEKALEQGKLALANEQIDKAMSNFKLAAEEGNSKEAKTYLQGIKKAQNFSDQVEEMDIKDATATLKELQEHKYYEKIQFITSKSEKKLDTITEKRANDTSEEEENKKDDEQDDDVAYHTYANERFGFSVEYPSSFEADYMPANNDGIEVHDDSATIIASGSHVNVVEDNETIETYYDNDLADVEGDSVSYKKLGDNWYVISYFDGTNNVYKKSIMDDEFIADLFIKYPADLQDYYGPIVETVAGSFKVD